MGIVDWKNKNRSEIPSTLIMDEGIFELFEPGSNILDLGCGTGDACIQMAEQGYMCYGIDISEHAIEEANGSKMMLGLMNCEFEKMDCCDIEYKDESFDIVIMKALLTAIPDKLLRKKTMEEAYRVLKKGGYLYILDFAQNWQNEYYRSRYLESLPELKEEGVFKVCDENGQELYTAKHFSNKEISDLYMDVGFTTYDYKTEKVQTRSGNVIEGFKIVVKK